jgi:GNAT superfamily N-acetyltransferase
MTDDVLIRPARPGDLQACCVLLHMLFSLEADFDFAADRARAALSMLIEVSPDHVVYVAQSDDLVVGMVSVQTLISTAEGGAAAVLEDLVVAEEHRGRGIASLLLEEVERWCLARDIGRIQLLADRSNHPALAFYGRRDWCTTRLIALRRRLALG